jgi:catechol 2,3-dioxygenase-like lactoylglutathione lyase family enzyme
MRATNIAFTGIPVTDMKRARSFYEGALGLKPAGEFAEGIWVEYEVGNDTIAIGSVGEQWKPSPDGTSVAIEVDGALHLGSADAYRRDRRKDRLLQEHGYTVLRFLAEDLAKDLDGVLDATLHAIARADVCSRGR